MQRIGKENEFPVFDHCPCCELAASEIDTHGSIIGDMG